MTSSWCVSELQTCGVELIHEGVWVPLSVSLSAYSAAKMAGIANTLIIPLADAGITIYNLSSYQTDFILVRNLSHRRVKQYGFVFYLKTHWIFTWISYKSKFHWAVFNTAILHHWFKYICMAWCRWSSKALHESMAHKLMTASGLSPVNSVPWWDEAFIF